MNTAVDPDTVAARPKRERPKIPEPGQMLTVPQIAFKLQLSESTVIRMITAGAISAICVRAGKRKKSWRVRPEVIERWLIAQERQTARNINCVKESS